jgi:hypothetical protein
MAVFLLLMRVSLKWGVEMDLVVLAGEESFDLRFKVERKKIFHIFLLNTAFFFSQPLA